MSKANTTNQLFLLGAPFLFTAFFVFLGYKILVAQTPQAQVSLPQQTEKIDILTKDEDEKIHSLTAVPDQIIATVHTVPNNRTKLANIINSTLETGGNTVYYSLPVDLGSDQNLILTDVNLSSEENITRWTKKAINTAHKNGLHTMLAITINATDVVKDPATFTQNYINFIGKWAKLATEYGVTFFTPGVTISHPIYSKLTSAQTDQLLRSIQSKVRAHYSGNLGVNLCCSKLLESHPAGYTYITFIPTNDLSGDTLSQVAENAAETYYMNYVFSYDKAHSKVFQTKKLIFN